MYTRLCQLVDLSLQCHDRDTRRPIILHYPVQVYGRELATTGFPVIT